MRLLLDSHILLWSVFEPAKLAALRRKALEDPRNDICVSAVSFWEISLKVGLGKLTLRGATPADILQAASDMGFTPLDLSAADASAYHSLPVLEHRDPFDRMLVWQAMQHNMTLVSSDSRLAMYQQHGLKLLGLRNG